MRCLLCCSICSLFFFYSCVDAKAKQKAHTSSKSVKVKQKAHTAGKSVKAKHKTYSYSKNTKVEPKTYSYSKSAKVEPKSYAFGETGAEVESAAYTSSKVTNTEIKPEAPACNKSVGGVKDFDGFTIGLGVNVGLQKTSAEATKFRDATSVDSTMYGGTATLGYQGAVCGNFTFGIEAGLDFGSGSKQLPMGGKLKGSNSKAPDTKQEQSQDAGQDSSDTEEHEAGDDEEQDEGGSPYEDLVHCDVLRTMFQNIGRKVGQGIDINAEDGDPYTSEGVHEMEWQGLKDTMHYIGGGNSDEPLSQTTRDYVGGNVLHNLSLLGDGEALKGLEKIRDFTTGEYEGLAGALEHLADIPLSDNGKTLVIGNALSEYGAYYFSRFLTNNFQPDGTETDMQGNKLLALLGIPANSGVNAAKVIEEVGDLYDHKIDEDDFHSVGGGNDNDNEDESEQNVGGSVKSTDDAKSEEPSKVKTKTSFGICPHVALKTGYYFSELDSLLYAKVGVAQLTGRVIPVNPNSGLKEGNFRKITPMFAIGFSKAINDHLGVSVEVSHALRTTKQLDWESERSGKKRHSKVAVSKSDIRTVFTYKF